MALATFPDSQGGTAHPLGFRGLESWLNTPANEEQVFFLQNRKLLIKHVRVGKEELVLVVIVGEFYQVQLE